MKTYAIALVLALTGGATHAQDFTLDGRNTNTKVCFELGDSSSRSYEAAKCYEHGDIPPPSEAFECTFADGYTTECFKHSNGCFVCEGMD